MARKGGLMRRRLNRDLLTYLCRPVLWLLVLSIRLYLTLEDLAKGGDSEQDRAHL